MMMKKVSLFFAVLLMSASVLCAQNPWEFIDPTPTGNTLNSVCFATTQTGFAVGNIGTILKTTNAGKTWVVDNSFKGEGYEYQRFRDIAFVNQTDGYISGYKLLKTSNGGDTWIDIPTGDLTPPNSYNYSYGACFLNNLDTGFVTGINPTTNNYELRKTNDGGATWSTKLILTPDVTSVQQICFSDVTFGWLVCAEKIYKTTDAGESWIEVIPSPSSTYYIKIYFTDNRTGYLLSGDGMIKTTDGGLTWSYIPSACTPAEIYFTNDSTGYIAGNLADVGGIIQRTINAGQTWSTVYTGRYGSGFNSIDFTDEHTGIAVGYLGDMIKIHDSAGTFTCDSLNKTARLFPEGNFFNDNIYVYNHDVSSSNGYIGGVYKYSVNNGVSWTSKKIDNSPEFGIRSMFFVNDNIGFAVSYDAMISTISKIYKTNDGGNTWSVKYITNAGYAFMDIYFVNETVGYAVGTKSVGGTTGIVYKSTDGGETWTVANTSVGKALYSVYFTSVDTGHVCGSSSLLNKAVIGKTTNGGVTWTLTNITTSPATISLAEILFTSSSTGYSSGYKGAIYKTTNSGLTWIRLTSGVTTQMGNICALNSDTVYVSTSSAYLRTTNGGTTWSKEIFNQDLYGQPSIHFYNDTTGIAIARFSSVIDGIGLRTGQFLPTSKLPVQRAGEYCFGTTGLPVYLPQTEYNVNYTLYKNGIPQTTLLANSDSLSFGNQLAGTYTVHATNQYGTTVMQDIVVITEIPLPSQPSEISGLANPAEGSSQVYSVTNVAGVTYNWIFPSGWVQTGGDTTNSVTVTVGSTAGDIVVTPSILCGNGTSRTLAVIPLPANLTISNIIVSEGQVLCYDAIQTIYVAGNSNTFTVQNGGSATMIAGQSILYFPETKVFEGGYLHGYISTQFCPNPSSPVAGNPVQTDVVQATPQMVVNNSIRIYPNPAGNQFTLELMGNETTAMQRLEIYNMNGMKMLLQECPGVKKLTIGISDLRPGIYFIHLTTNAGRKILKLIKL